MSVLKREGGVAEIAQRFSLARAPVAVAVDPLVEEIARYREQLAARDRELAAQADAADAALAAAYERGLAAAAGSEQDRLDALGAGIRQALSTLDEQLSGERDLAIEIAQAALTAMIGDAVSYRSLVAATAAHHAAALSHGTIMRLRVSAEDFPNEADLAALPSFDRAVDVVADPGLAAGACRFDLTLGALDASIPVQAAAIGRLLEEARAA